MNWPQCKACGRHYPTPEKVVACALAHDPLNRYQQLLNLARTAEWLTCDGFFEPARQLLRALVTLAEKMVSP